jgi:hypothetical protein
MRLQVGWLVECVLGRLGACVRARAWFAGGGTEGAGGTGGGVWRERGAGRAGLGQTVRAWVTQWLAGWAAGCFVGERMSE